MYTAEGAQNLVQMFERTVAERGDRPFLWIKQERVYRPWSWRRAADEARSIARCLLAAGLQDGDRVLLVGENRPEWCVADLAILLAGGIPVPGYTTNTPADHAHLLHDSGARFVVCSAKVLPNRLLPALHGAAGVRLVLVMDDDASLGELPFPAVGWRDALARGEAAPAAETGVTASREDVACIIYTSGTGGRPKGVVLPHRGIINNLHGAHELLLTVDLADEVFLSFLPLSHAYEHTAGMFLPISIGAEIYYAEGAETVSSNLLEARPTILACVPRLYEVLRQRIMAGVEREGGFKARLFGMAVALGRKRYEKGGLGPIDSLPDMALDRLVRDTVRARFGGRLKAMVSGGAPLNEDVGMFFHALGLPVLQGYGQTETSPVVSVNVPGRVKMETVGPPMKGVELKIADDGEILIRGDSVMCGYWNDPVATAAALRDGWLHTGDVGELDGDGYLRITDRKKDIIVNSGGDNVAPQRVEGILALEPEIHQPLVYGDRRPFLVALIVPHDDAVRSFAKANGLAPTLQAVAGEPAFKALVGAAVKRANAQLSPVERIRRFHIVDEPFTVENGQMTPTLKLKRAVICGRMRAVIDGLYDGPG